MKRTALRNVARITLGVATLCAPHFAVAEETAAKAETESKDSEQQSQPSLPMGTVCVTPLGEFTVKDEESGEESTHPVEFRIDSGSRAEGKKGARVALSVPRKHRIRLYAGETLVQTFNINLSVYPRPYVKMRKSEHHELWVLRQQRSGGCPYPEPTMVTAAAEGE